MKMLHIAVIAFLLASASSLSAEDPKLPTSYGDKKDDIASGTVDGLTWRGAERAYRVGDDIVLVFTKNEVEDAGFEIAPRYLVKGEFLLVAGGGAGGFSGECKLSGGGGGAGGMVEVTDVDFMSGSYAVSVGAGGEPNGDRDWNSDKNPNGSGSDSVLLRNGNVVTNAYGGGAGGIPNGNGRSKLASGRDGGSGGGGAPYAAWGYWQSPGGAGGASLFAQGWSGGTAYGSQLVAAGGGGAGETGERAITSFPLSGGRGGNGRMSTITGEAVWYAGGGAGGDYINEKSHKVVSGGAGGGGSVTLHVGDSVQEMWTRSDGGVDQLGGGGAGCASCEGFEESRYFGNAGRGGDGVVVVRFTTIRSPEGPLDGVSFEGESEWFNIGEGRSRQTVIVYTNVNAMGTLTLGRTSVANILLVGGGGAGGNSGQFGVCCGGGGAGGFVETNGVRLSGGTYSITVGKGGLPNKDCNTWEKSGNGTASILAGVKTRLTAFGGGGGGIGNGALNAEYAQGRGGDSIGSGGGGAYQASSGGQPGGVVDGSQGNNGGNHQGNGNNLNERIRCGAGGGGAGAAGANATQVYIGAAGGDGKPSSITGAEVWYAGGGAGGGYFNAPGVRKASGGNGGGGSSVITITQATSTLDPVSESGVDGLGGGGAGSCGAEGFGRNAAGAAGRGGNGIVVVRITEVSRPGILIFYR